MCILCVIQKWSRRVATMLPWLVIPLIGLWALSQLLPPAFRFEITSPRLACVFVLLVTLFWYEILMPQLSSWRVRRNARLREKKRFEAIELQKLRKTATRRCRNCLTPYRDQNPGGGKFMCSYCGHISKRPVLDLPVAHGMGISNSGIIKDLVGKGGKILNGQVWADNGWMCNGQDWLENGNWGGGSFAGKPAYWRQNGGGGFLGAEDDCIAENSYLRGVNFVCKLLMSFFISIKWLWRKVFRLSSSGEDSLSDHGENGVLAKNGENGANLNESRSDKARRKAEEKRQARLEKELLEEEERKQREEVAKLVEECRRLRDVKVESEKDKSKVAASVKDGDCKKEAERKCQERKRDKDKGSSKSNSDVDELEKKVSKENDRKREPEKKSDADRREQQKYVGETVKAHGIQLGHGVKTVTSSNYSKGNSGTRYLDRMKGSFFASSKALSDGSFFRRGTGNNATVPRENKFVGSVDSPQTSVNRRDSYQPERAAGRVIVNGDDKHIHFPVPLEAQIQAAPKKSWHQLFTRSSPVPPPSNLNVIGRPSVKSEAEAKNHLLSNHGLATQTFDNPLNFGLPLLFSPSSFPTGPTNRSMGFSSATDCVFPPVGEVSNKLLPEEPELFEDPCYTPDPASLLGPVSESLDNFQLDLGTSFASDTGLEKPWGLKNVSAPCEVSKPSPIESPLSRNRVTEDRHSNSNWYPSTPKFQNVKTAPNDNPFSTNDVGTWQMWNSSPLGQDGLGLIGAGANWFSSPEQIRSTMEEPMHPLGPKSMTSMFSNGDQIFSGADSVGNVFVGNCHKGGPFTSPVHGSRDPDPWLEKAFFPPLSGNNSQFALSTPEENIHSDMTYGSPSASARNHLFEQSSASCWPKKERSIHGGPVEGVPNQSPSAVKSHVGGLYSTPDVQSLWSYE